MFLSICLSLHQGLSLLQLLTCVDIIAHRANAVFIGDCMLFALTLPPGCLELKMNPSTSSIAPGLSVLCRLGFPVERTAAAAVLGTPSP